jgi:hypothetical protein
MNARKIQKATIFFGWWPVRVNQCARPSPAVEQDNANYPYDNENAEPGAG